MADSFDGDYSGDFGGPGNVSSLDPGASNGSWDVLSDLGASNGSWDVLGGGANSTMSVAEQNAQYGAGRQAADTAAGYGTNFNSAGYSSTAGTMQEITPSFMEQLMALLESPVGKIGRGLLSAMNPALTLANLGYGFATSKDSVATALGAIPGLGGLVASTAYGAIKSDDPVGFVGGRALDVGGRMLGGRLGGEIGGQFGAFAGSQLGGMAGREIAGGFNLGGGGLTGGGLASLGNIGQDLGGQGGWDQMVQQRYGGGQA